MLTQNRVRVGGVGIAVEVENSMNVLVTATVLLTAENLESTMMLYEGMRCVI
jgi:hypothetical protein